MHAVNRTLISKTNVVREQIIELHRLRCTTIKQSIKEDDKTWIMKHIATNQQRFAATKRFGGWHTSIASESVPLTWVLALFWFHLLLKQPTRPNITLTQFLGCYLDSYVWTMVINASWQDITQAWTQQNCRAVEWLWDGTFIVVYFQQLVSNKCLT